MQLLINSINIYLILLFVEHYQILPVSAHHHKPVDRKIQTLKKQFRTVVLKILESPLDSKGVKPTNPKGNQP